MSNLKSMSVMAAVAMGLAASSGMGSAWHLGLPAAPSKTYKRAGISMAQQQRNSRKARNVKRHKAAARG